MFLPVKPDFRLPRFPWATAFVCLVCILVFSSQLTNEYEYRSAVDDFCSMPRSRIETMVLKQIHHNHDFEYCDDVPYVLLHADDEQETIEKLMSGMRPLSGFDLAESREYVTGILQDELSNYRRLVPPDPDEGLAYYSESWNPITMVTSSFAHGGWSHIVFNLIFFIAFGTMVEMLISTVSFFSLIIAVSLITGVFTSISAMANGQMVSSVGLSGVVMAMMGLSAFLIPRGKIRCYYWFIVIFGSVAVPVWVLVLWYLGGDIYALFAFEDHGAINVMAHVTGGLAGYAFGFLFLKGARQRAEGIQMTLDRAELKPRFF